MEGNIIDAAKNLLGGDFTTELRFRYITIGDTAMELELDGGPYMVVTNYEGSKLASANLRFASDYPDYKIVYIDWDSSGPLLRLINSVPVQTNVENGKFRVFFAVRAI